MSNHHKITLNHIGIATEAGDGKSSQQLRRLFTILGLNAGPSEKVEEQGVQVHFFTPPGEAPHLELLEVEDPEGAVAKFISKKGPGIHHLSFLLPSGQLASICDTLTTEGFRLIYSEPKVGAQNMMINFIHPASCGGVLIELMEEKCKSN